MPNSRFYIRRRADADARAQLASDYPTITVKGYRQSGKSSLLVRLHHEAQESGHGSAYIDLQTFGLDCFESLETLLRQFINSLVEELDVDTQPETFFAEHPVSSQTVTRFLERHVFGVSDVPVLLIFDEADRLFDFPACRADFFTMLRSWHNLRARRQVWKKADWLSPIRQSPSYG